MSASSESAPDWPVARVTALEYGLIAAGLAIALSAGVATLLVPLKDADRGPAPSQNEDGHHGQ